MIKYLNDLDEMNYELVKKDRFIRLSNDYVRWDRDDKMDNTYSLKCGDKAPAIAYVLTKAMCNNGYIITSIELIMFSLGWDDKKRKRTDSADMIRETLGYMKQEGLITCENDFNDVKKGDVIFISDHKLFKYQSIEEKEFQGVFVMIKDYEFKRIMEVEDGVDTCKLFALFCSIKSRMNNKNGLKDCYPSENILSHDTGISKTTISKYIQILNDINLIRFTNAGDRLFPNGEYKTSPNNYVLCLHDWEETLKESIIYFKKMQKEKYGVKFLSKVNNKSDDSKEKKTILGKIQYLESKEMLNKKEKSDLSKLKKKLDKIKESTTREYVEDIDSESKRLNDESIEILEPNELKSDIYERIGKEVYSNIAYEEEELLGLHCEDNKETKESVLDFLENNNEDLSPFDEGYNRYSYENEEYETM